MNISTTPFTIIFTSLFFVSFLNQTYAQNEETAPLTETNDNINDISVELLPLNQLLDSAKMNSPLMHQHELLLQRKFLLIREQRNQWLKTIKLNSSYSWGNNYSIIDGSQGEISTNIASNRYGLGVSVSLPLYDLFSRKNTIKMAEIDYDIQKEEINDVEILINRTVTELYYQIELKGKILSIRNDALIVSNINFNYTELEFENNAVDISVYSRMLETKVKAKIAFQNAKTDYLISLINLEETVGIKLRSEL